MIYLIMYLWIGVLSSKLLDEQDKQQGLYEKEFLAIEIAKVLIAPVVYLVLEMKNKC